MRIVQKPSPVAPNGLLEVDPFLGGFKCSTVFGASHGVAADMLDRTGLQACRAVVCVSSHSLVVVGRERNEDGTRSLFIWPRQVWGFQRVM